ncbi:MAG: serine/threonine-protein kinase [Sandaracinus sp.]
MLEPAPHALHASLPPVVVDAPGRGPASGADLELLSELGRGGMGVVWRARQRSLGRDVAVKRVTSLESAHAVEALLTEARTMGRLEHPSIVPVHALGASADGPLLVMKRIEGTSLEALLRDPAHTAWPALERRHGERPPPTSRSSRACDALELARARHRARRSEARERDDGSFGETYLLDWGVARAFDGPDAEIGTAGTPSYMAPEMLTGRSGALGPHTDVYLLGGTLHAVLTGRPLHEGETFREVLTKAALSEPQAYPPTISADLVSLVHDATRRDPTARLADAAAFRAPGRGSGAPRLHRSPSRCTCSSIVSRRHSRRREIGARSSSQTTLRARSGAPASARRTRSRRGPRTERPGQSSIARWGGSPSSSSHARVPRRPRRSPESDRYRTQASRCASRRRGPGRTSNVRSPRAAPPKPSMEIPRCAVEHERSRWSCSRSSIAVNLLVIGGRDAEPRGDVLVGIGLMRADRSRRPRGAAFRRRLLANRWGRRAVALVFVAGGALVVAGLAAARRHRARGDDRSRRGARVCLRGRRRVAHLAPLDPSGVRWPRHDPRLRLARDRAPPHVRLDDPRRARGGVGVGALAP